MSEIYIFDSNFCSTRKAFYYAALHWTGSTSDKISAVFSEQARHEVKFSIIVKVFYVKVTFIVGGLKVSGC